MYFLLCTHLSLVEVLGSLDAPVDPPSTSFLPLCSTKFITKWSPNDQNTLGYFQIFKYSKFPIYYLNQDYWNLNQSNRTSESQKRSFSLFIPEFPQGACGFTLVIHTGRVEHAVAQNVPKT